MKIIIGGQKFDARDSAESIAQTLKRPVASVAKSRKDAIRNQSKLSITSWVDHSLEYITKKLDIEYEDAISIKKTIKKEIENWSCEDYSLSDDELVKKRNVNKRVIQKYRKIFAPDSKKDNIKKDKMLSLRIQNQVYNVIDKQSKEIKCSPSEWVRLILVHHIKEITFGIEDLDETFDKDLATYYEKKSLLSG